MVEWEIKGQTEKSVRLGCCVKAGGEVLQGLLSWQNEKRSRIEDETQRCGRNIALQQMLKN